MRRGYDLGLISNQKKKINRSADIIIRKNKIAIFVDGCFWHGCPIHGTEAKTHKLFWRSKIKRNRNRDKETNRQLLKAGWKVIRVWEHEDPEKASKYIHKIVVEQIKRKKKVLKTSDNQRKKLHGTDLQSKSNKKMMRK